MLKYIAHTDLKDVKQGDCSSICIYDKTGKLISFVAPFGSGRYIASTITDKDFENWVKILSLDKLHVES